MNTRVIKALIKKDLALFVSNRFYMLITIIGLVCYIGIYFVVPVPLDKKLSLAMYVPIVPPAFSHLTGHEGADVEFFSTEESLKQAVLDSDY
jgi:ABC-2 type transport system permease protein